ncbi:MAG: HAMP domain-containing histidine kinase [Rhodocyclaceae bacterium]|nr:MAG: HAMP domain-containing histidine kinase [Rhodocyclaceae bacterium]
MVERPPQRAMPIADGSLLSAMDMSTFLVASAHDMKNSVCVMTAYLESALADLPAEASSRAMTCQALYEAQRINHHLIQLLALYKINHNMYPFDPVEVELDSFEREVVARVLPFATAKGIVLEVIPERTERSWYFDYELIVSLITQSLHNAVKYTRSRVLLSIHVVDARLEIRVHDDGEGFPAFMLESSEEAAYGVNSMTGSTGLGLYFAAKVAQMHGNRALRGSTRLENGGVWGGATFILSLP